MWFVVLVGVRSSSGSCKVPSTKTRRIFMDRSVCRSDSVTYGSFSTDLSVKINWYASDGLDL